MMLVGVGGCSFARVWFRLQSCLVGRVPCCESDGRHARLAGKGRQLRSDCVAQWMCGCCVRQRLLQLPELLDLSRVSRVVFFFLFRVCCVGADGHHIFGGGSGGWYMKGG